MDPILADFLEAQWREATELADQSDLLELRRIDPQLIIAGFSCRGLVLGETGQVEIAERFEIAFSFPDHYLRVPDPTRVVTCLSPRNVFHPNCAPPLICIGDIKPGTPLVEMLYQTFEVLSHQAATVREDDALNWDACQWARNHQDLLPVDTRPLKRRRIEPRIDAMEIV